MTDTTQPNGAAPAAEATPSAPSQAEQSAQMVKDIMEFDPFGPAKSADAGPDSTGTTQAKPGEPVGEGQPDPKAAQPTDQQQPDPKAAQPAAAPPMQQGPTQKEQELQAQVAALQKAIQQVQQQPAQGQQQQTQQPEAKYNLGLPPQVIAGLRSEDEKEFAVSMHAVINGIANRLWTDMQQHIAKEVIPQIDSRAHAVLSQGDQVRQVHSDFYGANPNLKNPMIVPLVQNAALAVGKHWHESGRQIEWNAEFAGQVAELVYQVVPHLRPQQQQQQQAPVQQQPKPFVAGMGSRPPASKGNEFAELL